jgi:hypothetical protein
MFTSLSNELIICCITNNEKMSSDFVATYNETQLVYSEECGVIAHYNALSKVTCAPPSDCPNSVDCFLILKLDHRTNAIELSQSSYRNSRHSLSYISNNVSADAGSLRDTELLFRIVGT